jgi:hypothetical protein
VADLQPDPPRRHPTTGRFVPRPHTAAQRLTEAAQADGRRLHPDDQRPESKAALRSAPSGDGPADPRVTSGPYPVVPNDGGLV